MNIMEHPDESFGRMFYHISIQCSPRRSLSVQWLSSFGHGKHSLIGCDSDMFVPSGWWRPHSESGHNFAHINCAPKMERDLRCNPIKYHTVRMPPLGMRWQPVSPFALTFSTIRSEMPMLAVVVVGGQELIITANIVRDGGRHTFRYSVMIIKLNLVWCITYNAWLYIEAFKFTVLTGVFYLSLFSGMLSSNLFRINSCGGQIRGECFLKDFQLPPGF